MIDFQNLELVKYTDRHRAQLLDVWEKSVLATHDFLSPEDFQSIKAFVQTIDFNALDVYCLLQSEEVIGFLGVAEHKVEMLFLSPDHIGKGFGRKMMDFAVNELKADLVDVNEHNSQAVDFYKKYGFETYERTDQDDQGKDYPLLRMKLANK
ncbi:GNAT family N-acetyltransferase [Algoriphagus lacus]|uniref:GNAT family N-acetyltransferase n=1 Tax=Algoriphagus lacus TaxID=2056311 RepID=UPI001F1C273C|nr:GNAT family N-acetyltransferase [Algoriphagus lacus]